MSNGRIGFMRILVSTVIALLLTIAPLPHVLSVARPDWVLLLVIYWSLNAPMVAGLSYAWLCGLLVDALVGTLIGEHALALVLVAALAHRFQLRIRIFPILHQAVTVLMLVMVYHFLLFWIDGVVGNSFNSWLRIVPILVGGALWPVLVAVLDTANRRLN